MKRSKYKPLTKKDISAISELKHKIIAVFHHARFTLFGSKARGEGSRYSDIDILVLIDKDVTTAIEEQIFGIGFEVGLHFDVVFNIIVEEHKFWASSLSKAMPFHRRISREGIKI